MDILDHQPVELVQRLLEVVSIATPERYGIALIEPYGIRNTMFFGETW